MIHDVPLTKTNGIKPHQKCTKKNTPPKRSQLTKMPTSPNGKLCAEGHWTSLIVSLGMIAERRQPARLYSSTSSGVGSLTTRIARC